MPLQSSEQGAELGRRSGEVRRARRVAVDRIVTLTREAQRLPPTVSDLDVLDRVATLLELGGSADEAAAGTLEHEHHAGNVIDQADQLAPDQPARPRSHVASTGGES